MSAVDDLHPTEARWFALKVGHRKEKVVAQQLRRRGIETFLPLRDKPYFYASKSGVRKIPLLGGYLFVHITERQSSHVLQPTFVYGFVKSGRDRRRVRTEELDLLRRISSDTSMEWEINAQPATLDPGALVEIRRGPLAGVRGHYLEAKDRKTFIISFGGLDARLVSCEVSPDDIMPLCTTN